MGFWDWLGDAYDNSWLDQGVDAVSGIFDGASSGNTKIPELAPSKNDAAKGDSGFWSSFKNPNVLGSIITAGSGLFNNMSELDLEQQKLDRAKDKERFDMLLELAKLKYGSKGGGGGGGSQRNANADLIEVLMQGAQNKSNALDNFAKNYTGALT